MVNYGMVNASEHRVLHAYLCEFLRIFGLFPGLKNPVNHKILARINHKT